MARAPELGSRAAPLPAAAGQKRGHRGLQEGLSHSSESLAPGQPEGRDPFLSLGPCGESEERCRTS